MKGVATDKPTRRSILGREKTEKRSSFAEPLVSNCGFHCITRITKPLVTHEDECEADSQETNYESIQDRPPKYLIPSSKTMQQSFRKVTP
jgi:hypothetical protein